MAKPRVICKKRTNVGMTVKQEIIIHISTMRGLMRTSKLTTSQVEQGWVCAMNSAALFPQDTAD